MTIMVGSPLSQAIRAASMAATDGNTNMNGELPWSFRWSATEAKAFEMAVLLFLIPPN